MKKVASIILLALVALPIVGCGNAVDEGTVTLKTKYGGIVQIYKPGEPAYAWGIGEDLYTVTLRTFTQTVTAKVTSKDNAAIQVPISVTASTPFDAVEAYAKKFGFDEKERHDRRNVALDGTIQTEARNAFATFPAYEVYANQEAIQKQIAESLKPLLAANLFLTLESVQVGAIDFVDDRIEQAAAAVVANEKQKQSEEAALAAAEVAAKRKQVEAQTYKDPALFQIKMLELQLQIEQARADGIKGHQGPLTVVNGASTGTQLQLPASH